MINLGVQIQLGSFLLRKPVPSHMKFIITNRHDLQEGAVGNIKM